MSLEQKVVQILKDTRKTLAVAESCTGGLLSHLLTNVPGASKCLKYSIIAYSNEAKEKFLKVPASLIKKYGAVSEQSALEMAKGVRRQLNTDLGVSITGIAGPDGGTARKPVGLTYIALNTTQESICLKCRFMGNRIQVKSQAVTQALKLILEFIV